MKNMEIQQHKKAIAMDASVANITKRKKVVKFGELPQKFYPVRFCLLPKTKTKENVHRLTECEIYVLLYGDRQRRSVREKERMWLVPLTIHHH